MALELRPNRASSKGGVLPLIRYRRATIASLAAVLLASALTGCASRPAEPPSVAPVAAPTEASPELTAALHQACRTGWAATAGDPWFDSSAIADLLAEPTIVSVRGEWAQLMYVNDDGGSADCLVWLPDDDELVDDLERDLPIAAAAQVWGAGWGPRPFGFMTAALGIGGLTSNGSHPRHPNVMTAPLPADAIIVTSSNIPRLANIASWDDEVRIALGFPEIIPIDAPPVIVYGRVGADVTGLVLHTHLDGDVPAAVHDGWFAAMWPGSFGGRVCSVGTDPDGTRTETRCDPFVTASVTLADGSSFEVDLADVDAGTLESLPGASNN